MSDGPTMGDCEAYEDPPEPTDPLYKKDQEIASLKRMLKSIEWEGYDSEAGERACPNCKAWKFQGNRKQPIHAYRCSLGVLLGSPEEDPAKEIFWSGG